jgi:hypothetical protein
VRQNLFWGGAAAAIAMGLCRPAAAEGEIGVRTDVSLGGTVLRSFARPSGEAVSNVGVGLGLLVDARIGNGLAGIVADATTTIYNQTESFAGANFGFTSDTGAGVTILGELGAHFLRDVGRDSLIEVQSPFVVLPAAGLRLGLDRRRGPGRLDLGFWLFARADLLRETVSVVGTNCPYGCGDAQGLYLVGGFSAGAAFRIAFGGGDRPSPAGVRSQAALASRGP